MKNIIYLIQALLCIICFESCEKSEFLNKKPSTNILQPTTLTDFQNILDNTVVIGYTGALGQMSADEYEVSYANWQSLASATERNSYIWAKDIYGGDENTPDWNRLYQQVYYANSVLDGLVKSDSSATDQGKFLKGWALFVRAFASYDLTKTFCKAYDPATAGSDLGIPLRLSSNIDYTKQRATLLESLEQINQDLLIADNLLPSTRPSGNLNRPSKIAVYALLARISLDMRNYTKAESYADKCLTLYSKLIDYNTISKTSTTPFSTTNDELIYNTQICPFGLVLNSTSSVANIPQSIISLYTANDLRLNLYFTNANGIYTRKRGYYGTGLFPFSGLATDEIYLIKSECLARRGEVSSSMDYLNQLLIKRWNPAATTPAKPYPNLVANDPADALMKVLLERKKELMWRSTRWQDIKRLNKEGANITLTRSLNGQVYTLPPNDPRYAFPIPNSEIILSGLRQNLR